MSRQTGNNAGYAVTAKEGYLDRYKNFLMGWGRRFVKMDRSYLHHFEAKDAPNPGGSLVRGEITRCCINQSFKGGAGPFVFDVVCRNGTTWYFRAKSWEEMAEWMLAIFPNSKHELDRVRQGTSAAILDPSSILPPPIAPQQAQNPDFGVFQGDPPAKNPNAAPDQNGAGSSSSSHGNHGNNDNTAAWQPANDNGAFPPSYSDLFDRHDPAVQGKR